MRIELWDTEIDSIRTFDLESQRSIEQLDEILIYPATELVLTREELLQGAQRLRKEEKTFSEKLRKAMKTEDPWPDKAKHHPGNNKNHRKSPALLPHHR